MRIFGTVKLTCLLILTSQMIFAGNSDGKAYSSKSSSKLASHKNSNARKIGMVAKGHKNTYAISGFASGLFAVNVFNNSSSGYIVSAPQLGNGAVSLSQHRNFGKKEGAMELINEGVKVKKSGNYWVEFSAVVNNDNDNLDQIQVIVKKSENFNLDDPLNPNGFSVFDTFDGDYSIVQGAGILRNLSADTRISLVVRNNNSESEEQDIIVKNWTMTVYELED